MSERNIIILTHGSEGISQVCFAFKFAITLQSMGMEVDMYLASGAAIWANENSERSACVGGYETIQYYIDTLFENDGKLFVCCACYKDVCNTDNEDEMNSTLINGAECAGMGKLVELCQNSRVYTF